VFNLNKDVKDTDLQEAITKLISQMEDHAGETEEYTTMATNLKMLMEAREIEEKTDNRNALSTDTIVSVAGSLAGILMIISYERAHVLTSKALAHVVKMKI
jgi:hypothetical protein